MPEGEWQRSHGREELVSDAGIVGKRAAHPSDATWYNHMSAYNIRKRLGPDIWSRYFKFTVVRNPYDKLISGFYMFNKAQGSERCLQRINAYASKLLGRTNPIRFLFDQREIRRFRVWLQSFGELVLENRNLAEAADIPHYLKPIQLSLIDRDKYMIDGEECVDFFIHQENLKQGIKYVCEKLSIPFEGQEIPEFKKDKRHQGIPIRKFFDKPSQELVQELYAWEIARFGYDVPA